MKKAKGLMTAVVPTSAVDVKTCRARRFNGQFASKADLKGWSIQWDKVFERLRPKMVAFINRPNPLFTALENKKIKDSWLAGKPVGGK